MQHLKQKVISAVDKFMDRDSGLLRLKAHEQAISHRIAVYLEAWFEDCKRLTVDCEYNKHLHAKKSGTFSYTDFKELKKQFRKCRCAACSNASPEDDLKEKLFRPDIIVHSRGNDNANLLVVEIKTNVICPFDITKLRALTRPKANKGEYGYRLGLFLYFPKCQPHYNWILPSAAN